MKNIRLWIAAAVIMLALLCVGAASAEIIASGDCGAEGDNVAWTLNSEGVLSITGTGAMQDYSYNFNTSSPTTPWKNHLAEIKSLMISDGVTDISNYAFIGCAGLTSVVLSNNLTSIGDYAFRYCSNLTSIVIPDSVTSIGYSAFWECSSLMNIVLPDGMTRIGSFAFRNCSSLTSIVIPDGVTSIGYAVFAVCSNLTNIVIPDSVISIGYAAFNDCSSLMSIVIPDSVTSIGNYAFYGCNSLTSIVIPDSVTSIGEWAFGYCNNLTSIVIPNGATNLGSNAISNNTLIYCYANSSAEKWAKKNNRGDNIRYLTPEDVAIVHLPDELTEIHDEAYLNTAVEIVRLPESCTKIGARAFANCTQLLRIEIPAMNIKIAEDAFANSPNVAIYAPTDSAAQFYAEAHGTPYFTYPTE